MKPLTRRPVPRETQPLALQALRPRFITVYGDRVASESRAFLDQLTTGSSLLPHVVDAGGLTASQAIEDIARVLQVDSHLLLCIHGRNVQMDAPAGRHAQHYAQLPHRGQPVISTQALVRKIVAKLKRSENSSGSRPFIYLYSCESGALRKQIRPGSALWKSAYLITFSGSHSTSINSAGNAMLGAVAYADHCQRNGQIVDPMKLMLFAGLRSGDSVTLMGGDLDAPLVWHAPKSVADMSDTASLYRLSGSAQDEARFEQAVNKISRAESRLLPAASLMELLCNRLARDDVTRVEELLAAHPTLMATASAIGDLPLGVAAEQQASNCLLLLLEAGADPNGRRPDGTTALMLCVCHPYPRLTDMEMLLVHGADPNSQDADGYTALMIATNDNNVAAMQLLLAHGARMDLLTVDNIGCVEDAAMNNRVDALALLLASGAGPSSGLSRELLDETAAAGHLEAASLLRLALGSADASQEQ